MTTVQLSCSEFKRPLTVIPASGTSCKTVFKMETPLACAHAPMKSNTTAVLEAVQRKEAAAADRQPRIILTEQ
jgi:hypothetical protein